MLTKTAFIYYKYTVKNNIMKNYYHLKNIYILIYFKMQFILWPLYFQQP